MRLQPPPAQQGGICPTSAKFRSPELFLNRLQERGCSRARPPCRPAPAAFHTNGPRTTEGRREERTPRRGELMARRARRLQPPPPLAPLRGPRELRHPLGPVQSRASSPPAWQRDGRRYLPGQTPFLVLVGAHSPAGRLHRVGGGHGASSGMGLTGEAPRAVGAGLRLLWDGERTDLLLPPREGRVRSIRALRLSASATLRAGTAAGAAAPGAPRGQHGGRQGRR